MIFAALDNKEAVISPDMVNQANAQKTKTEEIILNKRLIYGEWNYRISQQQ